MYEVAEELERLAVETIMNSEILKEHNASLTTQFPRIAYLWSDSEKRNSKTGKVTYADTSKQSEKQSVVSGTDFIITFYRPNCEALSEEQMKILMEHELMHIGITADGDFFINPHDLEDFTPIVEKYGVDWAKTVYDEKRI